MGSWVVGWLHGWAGRWSGGWVGWRGMQAKCKKPQQVGWGLGGWVGGGRAGEREGQRGGVGMRWRGKRAYACRHDFHGSW